jgi:DNA-binding XRE family transcriptional regulator
MATVNVNTEVSNERAGERSADTPTVTLPARSPLRRVKLKPGQAGNRIGRQSAGLYPEVNRTALAETIGYDTASVIRVLNGTQGASLTLARKMARALGVTVERLTGDLDGQRAVRVQAKAKGKRKKGAKR